MSPPKAFARRRRCKACLAIASHHGSHRHKAGRSRATDPPAHHNACQAVGVLKGARLPLPEFTVDHFAVHGGTVQFVTAANHVESTLDNVELVGSLAEDGQLDAIVSARSGDQRSASRFKGHAPKGGFDGRPLPLDFAFEAPGLLQGALTGSTEVRATGSLIRFNNVNGTVAGNRFSGWASVDASDKPLVKVELDFQKLDIGDVRPPVPDRDRPTGGDRSAVEHGADQSRRPQLCRRRDPAFGCGIQLQHVSFRADCRQRERSTTELCGQRFPKWASTAGRLPAASPPTLPAQTTAMPSH